MWHDCHPLGAQILTATPPAMMVKRPPLEAQWTPAVAQEKRKVVPLVLLQKGFTKDFANTMTKEQLDLIPEVPPELVPAPRFGRSATTPSITTVLLWANIRILQGLYDLGCAAWPGRGIPFPARGWSGMEKQLYHAGIMPNDGSCESNINLDMQLHDIKCLYHPTPREPHAQESFDMFWSSQLPLHPPIPAVPAVISRHQPSQVSQVSQVHRVVVRGPGSTTLSAGSGGTAGTSGDFRGPSDLWPG